MTRIVATIIILGLAPSCGDSGSSSEDGDGAQTGTSVAASTADGGDGTANGNDVTGDEASDTDTDPTGVDAPCAEYAEGLALDVCTATYLAGRGDDIGTAVAIAADARVWWAGSIAGDDLGVIPFVLPGATDGAAVRLSSNGRTVESITRFGARIEDIAIMPDGAVLVGGDAGVALLEPDGAALRWSATPGSVTRVAADGATVVALVAGQAHAYDGEVSRCPRSQSAAARSTTSLRTMAVSS